MLAQLRLSLLKNNSEDFEWYPTTEEMIKVIVDDCGGISSILDIGAGDGRVLNAFDRLETNHLDKYAIEISPIHIENMPADISIVGTDFRSQTLIDKKVDVIFSNPPYSIFEEWAYQIIKEANAECIYLILPYRWVNSESIKQAMKQRQAEYKIIWTGDFLDADRQSRAKVDIVKFTITHYSSYVHNNWERENYDPFNVWFDEYFAGFDRINNEVEYNYDNEREKEKKRLNEIVEGQNLIEHLCNLYSQELNSLLDNYKTLSNLDANLLTEIGVKYDEIRKALKLKIEGLKNKYWKELFDHFDKITERLTSPSRKAILDKLHQNCNVDFSIDNAYAIAIWVIKNANKYLDQQLITVFKDLSEPECVKNYKSNLKTWENDGWRYRRNFAENHTHYILEYRIITQRHFAIETESYSWRSSNGLANDCHDFINDIFTIANNLGFPNTANSNNRYWESNKENEFWTNNETLLVKIRAFKNGNLHLKFNQNFIKTLNIEASRLLGWIKTPQEAAEEMDYPIEFVIPKFKSHFVFGTPEDMKLLQGQLY